VDPLLAASPLYTAVIECAPAESAEVEKEAEPLLSVPVPRIVVPSRNCTVPVAAAGLTVAVNVTLPPEMEGLRDEATAVVVAVLLTICEIAAEVAFELFWSPL
jgi:hypothetical protein